MVCDLPWDGFISVSHHFHCSDVAHWEGFALLEKSVPKSQQDVSVPDRYGWDAHTFLLEQSKFSWHNFLAQMTDSVMITLLSQPWPCKANLFSLAFKTFWKSLWISEHKIVHNLAIIHLNIHVCWDPDLIYVLCFLVHSSFALKCDADTRQINRMIQFPL